MPERIWVNGTPELGRGEVSGQHFDAMFTGR
jgi:hypothetical protein